MCGRASLRRGGPVGSAGKSPFLVPEPCRCCWTHLWMLHSNAVHIAPGVAAVGSMPTGAVPVMRGEP